jgi:hypothetical protein
MAHNDLSLTPKPSKVRLASVKRTAFRQMSAKIMVEDGSYDLWKIADDGEHLVRLFDPDEPLDVEGQQ